MLNNFLIIASRNLARNKVYSIINLSGLSLGLACAMLIFLFAKDEWSFDRFHKNVGLLYLIAIDVRYPDGGSENKMGVTGVLHGPEFKANLPEIESYTRLYKTFWDVVLQNEIQSQEVLLVDTNFFSTFDFPLLRGNPRTALSETNHVVLSEDMALRHFGTLDALDKTVIIQHGSEPKPYTVAGVARRCPQNSSIQFDLLFPLVIPAEHLVPDAWVNVSVNTFVKLRPHTNAAELANKMQQLFERESGEVMEKIRSYGFTQTFYHELQSFADIHLSQEFVAEAGLSKGSNPVYSYILSGIAFFILVIACINFVNLTIARSVKRAKEIGIRKVVGSARKQLVFQFLGESMLLCFLAFLSALVLAQLLLPSFNYLVNKSLSLAYLLDATLVVGYLLLFLVTGFIAGFYPAVVLSGYQPVETLYHHFKLTGKNYLQKSLVVIQFTLATLMIIGTLVIHQQFEFLTSKDLGYQPEQVVSVPKRHLTPAEAKIFSAELMRHPEIEIASPFGHSSMTAKINLDSMRNFACETIDENFLSLMGISLAEGRNFSHQFGSDSLKAVLVNETFVKMAGWKNPLGEEVLPHPFEGEKRIVVGVVRDYHFESLARPIEPQLFLPTPIEPYNSWRQMLVKIKRGSEARALPYIEQTFKKLFPYTPYTYQFLDDINGQRYASEARWKRTVLFSSVVTILLSMMGLFGLSLLAAEKRFKEIGIRKVLGASVRRIVVALSAEFIVLIAISLVIAMPVSFYACQQWLEKYPYRIEMGVGLFALALTLVVAIGLATISYQSIKTALMNPVDAIRRE